MEIDTVARCRDGKLTGLVIPLFAKNFSRDNLLEYKSEADKASKGSLSKLLGYIGLYGDQHSLGIDEVREQLTAWYIAARRPDFLDGLLVKGIITATADAGVYEVLSGFPCPCRVVVCDELDVVDDNIPLLVLGSINTIKSAITQLAKAGAELRHAMRSIKSLIYLFYRDKVNDMTEMKEMQPDELMQSVKRAILDLGIERTIEAIGVKEVVDAVGIDKLVDSIGIDKLKKAIARLERQGRK